MDSKIRTRCSLWALSDEESYLFTLECREGTACGQADIPGPYHPSTLPSAPEGGLLSTSVVLASYHHTVHSCCGLLVDSHKPFLDLLFSALSEKVAPCPDLANSY